jgi:ATP-dependent DNA ligase
MVAHALSRFGLDQHGEARFPRRPAPMLLQKADAPFQSADRTYDPNWDGFRILASIRDGSVRLVSR